MTVGRERYVLKDSRGGGHAQAGGGGGGCGMTKGRGFAQYNEALNRYNP